MDVRLGEARRSSPVMPAASQQNARGLASEQVARLLAEQRQHELIIASGFSECRGLYAYQLEELYQETVLALLHRPYRDEKHLLDALHRGIKQRALNLHRDEQRRQEILAESAPVLHAIAQARSSEDDPEQVALARQDRLIITEFLAELTLEQRRVFWLSTEGMHYNRIAKTLGITANQARNALIACERKRERFQLLYDSGRLCGYRSSTIKRLLEGHATSAQLASLALAHIQACAHCRTEHHTNAHRLRQAFQKEAAALLPPVLLESLGRLTRAGMHARILAHRLHHNLGPFTFGAGGGRERAIALIAGSSAGAKIATGIATVAVIAGGALTATHALEHHHAAPARHRHATHPATGGGTDTRAPAGGLQQPAPAPPLVSTPSFDGPGHVVAIHKTIHHNTANPREPGGFAYLGVPASTPAPAPAPALPARMAQPPATVTQTGGGPFSP